MVSKKTCFYFSSTLTLSAAGVYSVIEDWSSPTVPMGCMILYPFSLYFFMKHSFEDYYNQN